MKLFSCPCCGYFTFDSDGHFEICTICYWEDDPRQKIDFTSSGANAISLIEAQINYLKFGASESMFLKNVRKPEVSDTRDPNWKVAQDELFEIKLACRKFYDGLYSIEELTNNLSWISIAEEYVPILRETEYQLEMIRFCSYEYKQRDEAMLVINKLFEVLNINLE